MPESSLEANPYEPLADLEAPSRSTRAGKLYFWIGIGLMVCGVASNWIRNSPPLGWLLASTAFLIGATISGSQRVRRASLIALVMCVTAAIFVTFTHYQKVRRLKIEQQLIRARQVAD